MLDIEIQFLLMDCVALGFLTPFNLGSGFVRGVRTVYSEALGFFVLRLATSTHFTILL